MSSAHLRLEPPLKNDHAIRMLADVQGPARMPVRGLPGLGPPIHAPPVLICLAEAVE